MKRIMLGLTLLALLIGNYAYAATYTYTYTGNNFDQVVGEYSTSDSVSGSFTVAAALPADTSLGDISQQVLSYSFTDGVNTFNESNSEFCTLLVKGIWVSTDSNGNPNEWSVSICSPVSTVPSPVQLIFSLNAGDDFVADAGGDTTCTGMDGDACDQFGPGLDSNSGVIEGQAGTWMGSATPAPAPTLTPIPTLSQWSLILLALVLGTLGIARIRRRV